jgi:hypothetical protein
MDIVYAQRWQLVDEHSGRSLQLRFRTQPHDDTTGQLLAVLTDTTPTDHHDVLPLSRDRVTQTDVDAVLDEWQTWAGIAETLTLAELRRRIHAAGLD